MQRGNRPSARSGGDALRQRDCRSSIYDDKSSKCSMNAGNEGVKVDRHGAAHTDWIDKIAPCPVYHPTEEDFVDPLRYIQKIALEASEYGICKIVPPVVASVPAGLVLTKEQTNFRFTTRIQPMRLSNWDKEDKTIFPMSGRLYTLTEYEKVANKAFARKFSTAAALPTKFVEVEFWKELVLGKTRDVEYACDVEGSGFSESCTDPLGQSKWNLKGISRLPDSTLRLLDIVIPGVTEPMLYIGMLFSMFAWHIEDHYLYSINYHHCGAPKTWYGVPGKSAPDFEQIVETHVYETEMLKDSGKGSLCDLLLGKTTMFAPKLLSEHGVPVFRAVQNPGEFVITFPRAYHAGFSHGFNCGEAVNFAMADWFSFGAAACSRYEFLNRIPLLPHEELLCKEALIISLVGSSPYGLQHKHVKVAFVAFMRSQLQVCEGFQKQGAKSTTSSLINAACGLCKHTCYVAYTICNCYREPTCLNHDRFFSGCTCGTARSLVVRGDFPKLQAVAEMYESENEILSEVLKGSSICDPFVASFGIGVGEEAFLTSTISSVPEASNGLLEAPLSIEKRPNLCGGNNGVHSTGATSLDSKLFQEEESSDSEAFRVKQRRALPSHSKRFQVDEDLLSPRKLLKTGLEAKSVNDKKRKADCKKFVKEKKPEPIVQVGPILVQDIVNKLGIKGSRVEVIRRWQHDARKQGLTIKIKWVPSAGRLVEAISFKSCLSLKQCLTEEESRRLEILVQQAQPPPITKVNSSCSIQGDGEPVQKVVSDDRKNTGKSMNRNIAGKRQMLQETISESNAVSSSSGLVEEDMEFNGTHRSKGMLGRRKRETFSEISVLESSLDNTDFHCRKKVQKVSRLKVKGPTLPVLTCGTLPIGKNAGRVEGGGKSYEEIGGNVEGREHVVRSAQQNVQQFVGSDSSCKALTRFVKNATEERNLMKDISKRTEVTLGSEPRKIVVIHLNRKVDKQGGSVTSCNADGKEKQEKGEERNLGKVSEEADVIDVKPAPSWSSKEGLSASTVADREDSSEHRVSNLVELTSRKHFEREEFETRNHGEHDLDVYPPKKNLGRASSCTKACMKPSMVERAREELAPQPQSKELCYSFDSVMHSQCDEKSSCLTTSGNRNGSCNQQISSDVKDVSCRVSCPGKGSSHSSGNVHVRKENRAVCDDEEQASLNSRWRHGSPCSFIISDKSRPFAGEHKFDEYGTSSRCSYGTSSRCSSKEKLFCRPKSSNQGQHHDSHMDNVRASTHPHPRQGQESNKAQKFANP